MTFSLISWSLRWRVSQSYNRDFPNVCLHHEVSPFYSVGEHVFNLLCLITSSGQRAEILKSDPGHFACLLFSTLNSRQIVTHASLVYRMHEKQNQSLRFDQYSQGKSQRVLNTRRFLYSWKLIKKWSNPKLVQSYAIFRLNRTILWLNCLPLVCPLDFDSSISFMSLMIHSIIYTIKRCVTHRDALV